MSRHELTMKNRSQATGNIMRDFIDEAIRANGVDPRALLFP